MAQTTNAISMRNCKVEFSTNGSSWSDCSGFANKVDLDGGEREVGQAHTFDGETPVTTLGKKDLITVTLTAVYTEGASDVAIAAQDAYDNATDFYLRWSPRGGTSGQKQYTTSKGYVTKPALPVGEAGNGDPVMVEVEILVAGVTPSTVA